MKTLNKYLTMNLGGFPHSTDHILLQLSSILPDLFLIRLVNEILGLKMTWINIRKCCSLGENELFFDTEEFIKRYLTSNGFYSQIEKFLVEIKKHSKNLTDDPRKQIHRDDFFELLSYYIQKFGKIPLKICNPLIINGSLFGCIEKDHIKEEKLFKTLKKWALNN